MRVTVSDDPAGESRAPLPAAVGPSVWALPDPQGTDESGLVGFGADLAVETLVDAYRRGVFPWPHPGVPLPWFSPNPRGVLLPDQVHVSRSLARTMRRRGWATTVDAAFGEVIAACAAPRRDDTGTWITAGMQDAYVRLHQRGWAHSLEVWDGGALVGGIYGVRVGAVFTGESMFHRATDASKVALVDLAVRWREAGGELVDVQIATEHLRSMGVTEIPRGAFLARLAEWRDRPVRIRTDRLPASRLTYLAALAE